MFIFNLFNNKANIYVGYFCVNKQNKLAMAVRSHTVDIENEHDFVTTLQYLTFHSSSCHRGKNIIIFIP